METGVSYSKLEPDSDERFLSLRRELGITTFGINQILMRPGQRGRIHRHFHKEEVYLVLAGTLTLGNTGEATGPCWRGRRSTTSRGPTGGGCPTR